MDLFDRPPGEMNWIRGKLADHVGDHVVLSPEGVVLVPTPGTESSYPPPIIETLRRGKQVRRCLDEGDVPVLLDVASLWIPNFVGLTFLAIAAHLPFPGRGIELSVVVDVQQGSSFDDAKVRKVGFVALKHLEYRFHFEHLVRSPVLEVRRRHYQLHRTDDEKPLSVSMH